MKIKCDWCGSWINDFDQVCPNCGGVNNNYNRHANGVPQTIEELKAWAKEMNLPLEDMRTFIGEDYKGAKAFGIYKDETDGTFVVYKNKEDGTRAVQGIGRSLCGQRTLPEDEGKGGRTEGAPAAESCGTCQPPNQRLHRL